MCSFNWSSFKWIGTSIVSLVMISYDSIGSAGSSSLHTILYVFGCSGSSFMIVMILSSAAESLFERINSDMNMYWKNLKRKNTFYLKLTLNALPPCVSWSWWPIWIAYRRCNICWALRYGFSDEPEVLILLNIAFRKSYIETLKWNGVINV